MFKKNYLVYAAIAIACGAAGVWASLKTAKPPAPAAAGAAAAPAGPVAALFQQKLKDGKGVEQALAQWQGKPLVVNFWATWCAPCRKEMPELSALHAMRSEIEVVGLAYEDIEPAEMKAFLEKRPVTYPIVIVDTYNPPEDFAIPRGLPLTYLIAPDGKVAKQFLGPVTAADIEARIKQG